MHVRFIALDLGTPEGKGTIFRHLVVTLLLQPFDSFSRRMFAQRIRKNLWVSCRNFGGISFNAFRDIVIFRIMVYILRNKRDMPFRR